MRLDKVTNIVFTGLGGRGIITASDICALLAVYSGADVKKSALKGIAQRGGLVVSHVRFGPKVYSPRVEPGAADFAVSIGGREKAVPFLAENGILIDMPDDMIKKYGRFANIYALGILSRHLPFGADAWEFAIKERFLDGVCSENIRIFKEGATSPLAIGINENLLSHTRI